MVPVWNFSSLAFSSSWVWVFFSWSPFHKMLKNTHTYSAQEGIFSFSLYSKPHIHTHAHTHTFTHTHTHTMTINLMMQRSKWMNNTTTSTVQHFELLFAT